MMGHTDRATINARRPLTAGMRDLLRLMARPGGCSIAPGDHVDGNRARGLMDRGYARPAEGGGNPWTATDAGREALA